MTNIRHKPRLAIVSPFLDKSHGTERIIVEWIAGLTKGFDIDVYSQKIEDLDLSGIVWHRIPELPGPHLFGFLWWFMANQIARSWQRRVHGRRYDLIFSPGCNCLDADVVSVHIVFAEYVRNMKSRLNVARHSVADWPRLLHREIYYKLVILLERRIYTRPDTELIVMTRRTAAELQACYRRGQEWPVVYPGLDHETFNPERCLSIRKSARKELNLSNERFVLLLVGNDWRNKGVPVLLEALEQLRELSVNLMIVSHEDASACLKIVREKQLEDRVRFMPPRKDIEFYYAAADAYVGPSLQDTYAIPPAEAMACGLPVIVSASAGVSEIITNGVDGLILENANDATALALMIRRLTEDGAFRAVIGNEATATAQRYTWERSALELTAIFDEIMRRRSHSSRTLAQGI